MEAALSRRHIPRGQGQGDGRSAPDSENRLQSGHGGLAHRPPTGRHRAAVGLRPGPLLLAKRKDLSNNRRRPGKGGRLLCVVQTKQIVWDDVLLVVGIGDFRVNRLVLGTPAADVGPCSFVDLVLDRVPNVRDSLVLEGDDADNLHLFDD